MLIKASCFTANVEAMQGLGGQTVHGFATTSTAKAAHFTRDIKYWDGCAVSRNGFKDH